MAQLLLGMIVSIFLIGGPSAKWWFESEGRVKKSQEKEITVIERKLSC